MIAPPRATRSNRTPLANWYASRATVTLLSRIEIGCKGTTIFLNYKIKMKKYGKGKELQERAGATE